MSNKERVMQLIEDVPDYKLTYVIDILNSIRGLLVEEVDPDGWDLQMIEDAQRINKSQRLRLYKAICKLPGGTDIRKLRGHN